MTKKSPPSDLVLVSCALCGRLHSAEDPVDRYFHRSICSHCGNHARTSLGRPHNEIFVSVQGSDATGH